MSTSARRTVDRLPRSRSANAQFCLESPSYSSSPSRFERYGTADAGDAQCSPNQTVWACRRVAGFLAGCGRPARCRRTIAPTATRSVSPIPASAPLPPRVCAHHSEVRHESPGVAHARPVAEGTVSSVSLCLACVAIAESLIAVWTETPAGFNVRPRPTYPTSVSETGSTSRQSPFSCRSTVT